MKCLRSHTSDPYFNLAAEEYLLKHFNEAFYFQYVDAPSVVVGKHQNAMAEIDMDYLERHGISLARRISGGGAVYHDEGNLNYAFITDEKPGNLVRFGTYTAPVIGMLNKLDVKAYLGKRNEILTPQGKISGTASHVYKNRVLHHGTLLFDADLEHLARCLYVDADHFTDKAVKSVRSDVVNISGLLSYRMEPAMFYDHLFYFVLSNSPENREYNLSTQEIDAIRALSNEKFRQWEWNYGYSPRYQVKREIEGVRIRTFVDKGRITGIEITGSVEKLQELNRLNAVLTGERHEREQVAAILRRHVENELVGYFLGVLF